MVGYLCLRLSFGLFMMMKAMKHAPSAARAPKEYSGTTNVGTKFAVMVPVPPIVAVVVDELELPKTIEPVFELHDAKVNPIVGVAEIGLIVKASSYQLVPEGVVEPAPDGDTAKVT